MSSRQLLGGPYPYHYESFTLLRFYNVEQTGSKQLPDDANAFNLNTVSSIPPYTVYPMKKISVGHRACM